MLRQRKVCPCCRTMQPVTVANRMFTHRFGILQCTGSGRVPLEDDLAARIESLPVHSTKDGRGALLLSDVEAAIAAVVQDAPDDPLARLRTHPTRSRRAPKRQETTDHTADSDDEEAQ